MEVLIAMGIFTIGFVAVAAIFPSAILLQKRTIQEIESDQVAMNVRGLISARLFDESDLTADSNLSALGDLEVGFADDAAVRDFWTLSDRAYLANFAPDDSDADVGELAGYFWIPLFIDVDTTTVTSRKWEARVFVVRRNPTESYTISGPRVANDADPAEVPKVRSYDAVRSGTLAFTLNSAEEVLDPGDPILLSNGGNVRVASVDPTSDTVTIRSGVLPSGNFEVWIAPPASPGGTSPAREVIVIQEITP